eukprot:GDKH01028300.1.p2 GENE.GDKH01028300.1~~GDKH01028300.1.p2  ORF type:complete len:61 (-),score=0.75 GDKH01028300.1:25-183(-)
MILKLLELIVFNDRKIYPPARFPVHSEIIDLRYQLSQRNRQKSIKSPYKREK